MPRGDIWHNNSTFLLLERALGWTLSRTRAHDPNMDDALGLFQAAGILKPLGSVSVITRHNNCLGLRARMAGSYLTRYRAV
ncbi:hypothetical protein SEA_TEACUP_1 [Arthrobacter phage Teacup]|uniref:Uncharacterized protein n=2 Tax=Gordonvirus TaxID=1982152 RepID=A0A9E7TB06_9CAUD|nr:hypothetical protein QCN31_gp01 [Arthrobacter phage Teacup]YP_010750633.1 hypothetical protein QCN41_gp01 [Arthrobacter phage ScienceWizSam]ASR84007.1 hypothetical protein SEA_TEACUP_1 [Arthrobacter phage Teacup]UUG69341.1 hypothetical protein SEA_SCIENCEWIZSAM_1 [Arthrobacter phage ScienceWizSam]